MIWHPATDQLAGTEPAYGSYTQDPTIDATFGVPFDNVEYDQFMFATGDGQLWLIANKAQVQEEFGYSEREILQSSTSSEPYTARWYHRASQPEDPWISIIDHADAITEGSML